jgi:hypothetical protein
VEEEPPICPRCGVTMLPDKEGLLDREGLPDAGGWVCAECEDAGVEPDEA